MRGPVLAVLLFAAALLSLPAYAACPGCCSSHGGVSNSCSISGRIYCNDGTVSPTCTCGSCGVNNVPPGTSVCPLGQSIVDGGCFAPAAAGSCGIERLSIKTGTDSASTTVDTQGVLSTTLSVIGAVAVPTAVSATFRTKPVETSVYVVDATLTSYRLTEDSEYYLVLSDGSGKTMIAEIPHPTCVGVASPFKSAIAAARNTVDATLRTSTAFKSAAIPVRVYGVGFLGGVLGQTGVSANGVELNPVLRIEFNPTQPASVNHIFPLARDADRVFNWAETVYPQYFPAPSVAGTYVPYSYRYYAGTGTYLGAGNGRAVVHNGRDWNFLDVGAISDFLELAKRGGY